MSAPKPADDHAHVRVDPANFHINRRFFRRLGALAHPYWTRKGGWRSWLMLAVTLLLSASYGAFGGVISSMTAHQTNALVGRQVTAYWQFWLLVTAFGFLRYVTSMAQNLFGTYINLHWRRWLTTHLIDEYLSSRTYYEITVHQNIDNPDQRIQEEVAPFCQAVTSFPRQAFSSGVDIMVQIVILSHISMGMLIATIVYAVVQFFLNALIYRPTVRQQFESTVAEADLRFGLLHVRDNAETIAFYRGEAAEREHLVERLSVAIAKQLRIVVYQLKVSLVSEGSGIVLTALPLLLIAPLYFAGKIQYGSIVQGTIAAAMILESLSVLTRFIPILTAAAPNVIRLAEIQEEFQDLQRGRRSDAGTPRIALSHRPNSTIKLRDVSVQTPGGERSLIRDLSLDITADMRLLIVGQTGLGKSSLLRAMAGLWTRGEGRIELPDAGDTMFLPQRPYMLLADLRTQLIYPAKAGRHLTDHDLQAVLERVGLPDLAEQVGGFEVRRDWSRMLSLGEQQRIAFARILVAKPRYVFLDEGTSALDHDTEKLLYQALRRTGATYISVAHRQSVYAYHNTVLRLRRDGWALETIDQPLAIEA